MRKMNTQYGGRKGEGKGANSGELGATHGHFAIKTRIKYGKMRILVYKGKIRANEVKGGLNRAIQNLPAWPLAHRKTPLTPCSPLLALFHF